MFKTVTSILFCSLAVLGRADENSSLPQENDQLPNFFQESEAASDDSADFLFPPELEIKRASCALTDTGYSQAMYHTIIDFAEDHLIKLEDGSEWNFDPNHVSVVASWAEGATVVISLKGGWFYDSNYDYVLTNQDTNESISANLFDGPVAFGNYTFWVGGIDPATGRLYVKNSEGTRSVWEVAPSDIDLLKEWAPDETLMVAQNTNWFWYFSEFNHVIVNVGAGEYIRAHPIEDVSSSNHIAATLSGN